MSDGLTDVGLVSADDFGLSLADGVDLAETVVVTLDRPGIDTEHAVTPSNATAPTARGSACHRPVVNGLVRHGTRWGPVVGVISGMGVSAFFGIRSGHESVIRPRNWVPYQ